MKASKHPLRALWEKLRRKKRSVVLPIKTSAAPQRAARTASALEPLENRVAPATLISGSVLNFQDADGDTVTVRFSKSLFNPAAVNINTALDNVFKFSAGDAHSGNGTAQQLQLIDLTQVVPLSGATSPVSGVSITVSVAKAVSGDGFADIGAIEAAGFSLGAVNIAGDLGQIDAGVNTGAVAVKSLTVQSLGVKDFTTQPSSITDADKLESRFLGQLGVLKVAGSVEGYVHVVNGTAVSGKVIALGKIGSVSIGGSLAGNSTVATTSDNTGRIHADSNIGVVKIASITGGGGANSGVINAGGIISSVTLTGSLIGGAGASAGGITASGAIGAIKIGTSLSDGIVGGSGSKSGAINAGGKLTSFTLAGSLTGGSATGSASVFATGGIGVVRISGDVLGGGGLGSGLIDTDGALGNVTILGKLAAGTGGESGLISSGTTMGAVIISGSVTGVTTDVAGNGSHSGGISAGGKLASVSVSGSLLGGKNQFGGFIEGLADVGAVRIGGAITGGDGSNSGVIVAGGKLASATVLGSVAGGGGAGSGSIFSGADPDRAGNLTTVKIGGSLAGGSGINSGAIVAGGPLSSVTIGSLTLLVPAVQGGGGAFSGGIFSDATIAAVKIVGDVVGGGGADSGAIQSFGLLNSVNISGKLQGGGGPRSGTISAHDDLSGAVAKAGDLGAIAIGGQLAGGAGTDSGAIRAEGNLRSLTVGSVVGGSGDGSGGVRTGEGILNPGNSGAIRILGTFAELDPGTPGVGSTSIVVGGNLSSLSIFGATDGATVRVGDALGALSIRGNVSDMLVTARGQAVQGTTTDVAIRSISIVGSVTDSEFLAGYRLDGAAVNPDAQIGAVAVTGAWTASSLVAGVVDTDADGFGDADDASITSASDKATIISRIASVVIGGAVSGSAGVLTDHFGFVAEKVGGFKVGGVFQTTRPVQELDLVNNDVSIREVV